MYWTVGDKGYEENGNWFLMNGQAGHIWGERRNANVLSDWDCLIQ